MIQLDEVANPVLQVTATQARRERKVHYCWLLYPFRQSGKFLDLPEPGKEWERVERIVKANVAAAREASAIVQLNEKNRRVVSSIPESHG